jgi:hypothetical protein
VHAQLAAGAAQVGLDGLRAQRQAPRGLGVTAAERNLAQHVELPGGERRPVRARRRRALGSVEPLEPAADLAQPRAQHVVVELPGDAEQFVAQVMQVTGGEAAGLPGHEGGGLQQPDPAVHLVADSELGGELAGDVGEGRHRPVPEGEHRADRGVQHAARGAAGRYRRGDDGPDALAPHLVVVVVGDVGGRDVVVEGDRPQFRDGVPADPAAVPHAQAVEVVGLRPQELLEYHVVPGQLPAEGERHSRVLPCQTQRMPVGGGVIRAQHRVAS